MTLDYDLSSCLYDWWRLLTEMGKHGKNRRGVAGESSSLGCGKGELSDTDEMSDVESDTWNSGKVSAEYKNLKEYTAMELNKQFCECMFQCMFRGVVCDCAPGT